MERVLHRETLVQQVHEVLRERIVTLEFAPGAKLPVDDLARSFGISRTPVREALNLLVEQGLVAVRPRVGYYVVSLTPREVQELADVRRLFELFAVEQACARLSDRQIRELEERTLRLTRLSAQKRAAEFNAEDQRFHRELLQCTGNRRLQEMAGQIHAFVELMRHMNSRVDEALQEHLVILEALKRRDVEAARAAMSVHLQNVTQAILAVLEADRAREQEPASHVHDRA